jgi:hypothetical protein
MMYFIIIVYLFKIVKNVTLGVPKYITEEISHRRRKKIVTKGKIIE